MVWSIRRRNLSHSWWRCRSWQRPKTSPLAAFSAANKSGRAVAFVIVRHGGAASALQRQAGLGTIQGLNLALLVGAQHQRVLRRIEIQADDVFQFLGECRIVADLE